MGKRVTTYCPSSKNMIIQNKEFAVGIIGWGVVGKSLHKLFRELVIAVYDPFVRENNLAEWLEKEKIEGSTTLNTEVEFRRVDMAIVCVPTPTDTDGESCDVSFVDETLHWLEKLKYDGVVLIKSTIPPSELIRMSKEYKLRICFSPEYIGMSKYATPPWKYPDPEDMKYHSWQIIGGKKEDTSTCVSIFQRKMSPDCQYFQVDLATASLAKYAENTYFALKVTFCNELYDICQKYGVDYNELRECWAADPRVGKFHTLVFPKDRGYGGRCYPKDTKAIIADSKKIGYVPELLVAVDKVNDKMRAKNEE